MSIFPNAGVPPSQAINAVDLDKPPASGNVLYFPKDCAIPITDEWRNTIISEILCAIDACDDICYDPSISCNLLNAIECIRLFKVEE